MTSENGSNDETLYSFKEVLGTKSTEPYENEIVFSKEILLPWPQYRQAVIKYRNETMGVNK